MLAVENGRKNIENMRVIVVDMFKKQYKRILTSYHLIAYILDVTKTKLMFTTEKKFKH